METKELENYFRRLPKDTLFQVNDNKYKGNREIMYNFSPVIRDAMDSATNNVIKLDIEDPGNVFDQVVNFLHGQSIRIRSENVHYLEDLAEQLSIDPLKRILRPYLEAETNLGNVIFRLRKERSDADCQFFLMNIENLMSSDVVYQAPPDMLLQAVHESHFSSEKSKYFFAMKCALHVPDLTEKILTPAYVQSIPIEIIKEIINTDEFSPLESRVPGFVDLARQIIRENRDTRTEINSINEEIKRMLAAISELAKKNSHLELCNEMTRERLENMKKLKDVISEGLLAYDERVNGPILEMHDHKISSDHAHAMQEKMTELRECFEKAMKEIQVIRDNVFSPFLAVTHPDEFTRSNKAADEWKKTIDPLDACIQKIRPTDECISRLENVSQDLVISLSNIRDFLDKN